MKNVIITGSNGMVGKLVLENCLNNEAVAKVTSITRKPTGIRHSKLVEILHHDFLNYSAIETHFSNQDACFYCIGVYTGQVPASEFKKITVDFTRSFAETLRRYNPQLSFCFLSGQGADSSEKSSVLFAKQKGIAENALIKLQFQHIYIFRPGYIYPESPRSEPNLFYRIMRPMYKPVSAVYPNIGVTSGQLARKMVNVGLNGGDRVIYENKFIRQ